MARAIAYEPLPFQLIGGAPSTWLWRLRVQPQPLLGVLDYDGKGHVQGDRQHPEHADRGVALASFDGAHVGAVNASPGRGCSLAHPHGLPAVVQRGPQRDQASAGLLPARDGQRRAVSPHHDCSLAVATCAVRRRPPRGAGGWSMAEEHMSMRHKTSSMSRAIRMLARWPQAAQGAMCWWPLATSTTCPPLSAPWPPIATSTTSSGALCSGRTTRPGFGFRGADRGHGVLPQPRQLAAEEAEEAPQPLQARLEHPDIHCVLGSQLIDGQFESGHSMLEFTRHRDSSSPPSM